MKTRGRPLQYACFACRKSFKIPQVSGGMSRFMTSEQKRAQEREASQINGQTHVCPDCRGPLHLMGLDFKAPKESDVKNWEKAQAFVLSGNTYYRRSR